MSKAILVMDMPKNCRECKFYMKHPEENPSCFLTKYDLKGKKINPHLDGRHFACPLENVPEKRTTCFEAGDYGYGCVNGWNFCVEKILRYET